MAISYKPNITINQFPTKSHPTTHRIEKELNNMKTFLLSSFTSSCKPSTEAVCEGLLKLSSLYECMDELISSLSFFQNEKWVEELMDQLVGLLDACGIMRDIVFQSKKHVIALQCALRRRKGDLTLESCIAGYNNFGKRIRKDVKRLIARLKQSMGEMLEDYNIHHNEVVIRIVKEVREVTITVFESLLNLFVMADSRTTKENKWSLVVSKFIKNPRVTCEGHHNRHQEKERTTIFEGLDVVSLNRCNKDGFSSWSYGRCRLQTMEAQIGRIEDGLESIYRKFIRTRMSLLNIISHY